MDDRERYGDIETSLRVAIGSALLQTWTALPGIVVSFNPAKCTAVVQPAIEGTTRDGSGVLAQVSLPLLNDVPVVFPGAGGVTLTLPLAKGDEVELRFQSRCIDQWFAGGGVRRAGSNRKHDLSDAVAYPGLRSLPRALSNISTAVAQLRSDDGATFVSLDPVAKAVEIVASGGIKLVGPVTVTGTVMATGDISANGTTLETHIHSSAGGSGNSGPPLAGT